MSQQQDLKQPIKTKKLLGVFFIVVGFIILITPFTPGSILLIIGLDMVFGDRWPWLRKINTDIGILW
ncbi:MAG: hypothetical protein Q8P69_01610, partial [bacterium]|nr:hypothetical protein [bacterium]